MHIESVISRCIYMLLGDILLPLQSKGDIFVIAVVEGY